MSQVTPIPLGYNTAYLWEGDGARILVDTGPDFEGSWTILKEALGHKKPDLVVATHGHLDHAGLGRRWQAEGIPVAVGKADDRLVRGHQFDDESEFQDFCSYFNASGAPPDVAESVLVGIEAARARVAELGRPEYPPPTAGTRYTTGLRMDSFAPAQLLDGDCTLPGGLQVLSAPGHTRGNLVLWDESEGWLFSGDQLLEDITPTPGIQWIPKDEREPDEAVGSEASRDDAWRFRSLPAYVTATERLGKLDPSRCFPGHGTPFGGVGALIRANLETMNARTERVRAERGKASSLYELCERLYPRAAKRRPWPIVATVQGHLDLLEAEIAGR